jgi:hypothetical protein
MRELITSSIRGIILSGDPMLVRDDHSLNFGWEKNALAPSLLADGFLMRWARGKELEPRRTAD